MEHEIILTGTVTVPAGKSSAEGRYIHEDVVKKKDEEIEQLRYKNTKLRREITDNERVLHRKNKELDALGIVWCSGGCDGGMARYTKAEVTEEMVKFLERNAERARTHVNSRQCTTNRARREKCPVCQMFEQCKMLLVTQVDGYMHMSRNEVIRLLELTLLQQEWAIDSGDDGGLRIALDKWGYWDSPEVRTAEHHGKCTNAPCSCNRCESDERRRVAEMILAAFHKTDVDKL